MIERLWELLQELAEFVTTNFDPARDILDIAIVAVAIYWVLLLIRGTRAVQILVGLVVLLTVSLASDLFSLLTVRLILDMFLQSMVLIIIILFQNDIRRALARVGRGFFPSVSAQQESQMLEEVVRAAQALSRRHVGALFVIERETGLSDQVEIGTPVDAAVSKELLTTLFLSQSPLHDGAALIQNGRVASAGCILPLTLKTDLPEGVGTRHRAAVGITEETDAVVVVVSEETSAISVVMGGEILHELDAPQLRHTLRDIMSGNQRDLSRPPEAVERESSPADETPRERLETIPDERPDRPTGPRSIESAG
ncbi:MAG: TIGR00159 family protein [Myxococcales bacterium]|nr:TIGR00159 family protein [Myxococcales bacterium]